MNDDDNDDFFGGGEDPPDEVKKIFGLITGPPARQTFEKGECTFDELPLWEVAYRSELDRVPVLIEDTNDEESGIYYVGNAAPWRDFFKLADGDPNPTLQQCHDAMD